MYQREKMLKKIIFLTLGLVTLPCIGWAASCSRINLTRCLDSACAINISSNPGARCQYCGTADAGTPPNSKMKSVAAGASSKNTISAKDLKKAPTDPGDRYVWATRLCLEIVPNCSADDVSEAYDPLIERSCTAAGINADMDKLQKKAATNTKTATGCINEITVCVTAADKCDTDFSKCKDDETFNNFFGSCSSRATGCTAFLNKARDELTSSRTSTLNATEGNIEAIVNSHKKARETELASIKSNCSENTEFDKCVTTVCANNTNDNCGSNSGKTIANSLCAFYKTACTKIK